MMKETDDKTRTDNTAFPYSEIADEFSSEAVEAWTRRCMADFPDKTLYDENGRKIYSTSLIDWWKEKWFSQFKEKP